MTTVATVAHPAELDSVEVSSLPELLALSVSPSVLSKSQYTDYLAHLTDLPLAALESEPTTLQSSSAQLTNALTTLCHTSYSTFLSLHSTTSTLSSSLGSLSSSLDSLLSALPALESSARAFAQETRDIQKERRQATLVLEQHDKLYDVLSLPMLLDSCVRNHNYNEALLLSNHASSLLQRFPANSLIQSVKSECDSRVQAMLGQLLGSLREQAKLPTLFRSVNFLRKMEVLDEQELALAFLTGRSYYLDNALRATEIEKKGIEGVKEKDKESYARFLKRYVDVWREGVYDVITQYTTIFLDKAPSTSSAPPADLHILIRVFTTSQLQALLSLLRVTLPLIPDPAMLTSLLKQLTYCANSFARVGMDFKALLSPIFVDAVRDGIAQELEDATTLWASKLSKEKSKPKRPSQLLVSTSAHPSPPLPTPGQLEALKIGPAHSPPQILSSYPPLALYTNDILTALNSLRMLAPVELYSDLFRIMQEILKKGAFVLLQYAKDKPWTNGTKSSPSMEDEEADKKVLEATGRIYFLVFVPFILRGLSEGVYGRPVGDSAESSLVGVKESWQSIFPLDSSSGSS
ncbi:Dor1-like family-domain-containing protein [Irpex rosettiformis]|uniref:Dor1-like family-domain-containing protein n=1 Tax=Irpex rosettiformis TaxID=378272 RepID=A0ACB8UL90_9APHY|nr:Dor1-like family-domain-containing protein [Irpex rosettiformis]